MPTSPSSASASVAEQRAGGAAEPPDRAATRDQRHLHVLAHRHRGEGRRDLEGARRRRAARCGAAPAPRCRVRRSSTRPASGRSWPLSRSKQVDLPAPFGPISASISPARDSNDTSCTARTPPNDLRKFRDVEQAHASRPRSQRRRAAPGDALGKRQHQSRMIARPSTKRHMVGRQQQGIVAARYRRARRRSGRRSSATPPSSTISSASTECADAERRSGNTLPLAKANSPPASPAAAPASAKAASAQRSRIEPDRLGAQRASPASRAVRSRTARRARGAAAARRRRRAPGRASRTTRVGAPSAAATRPRCRCRRRSARPIGTRPPRRSARRRASAWRDRRPTSRTTNQPNSDGDEPRRARRRERAPSRIGASSVLRRKRRARRRRGRTRRRGRSSASRPAPS